jgi:hypothetical protein
MHVRDLGNNLATHNLTLDGDGMLIDGTATKVLSTNGVAVEYFFRADLAEWVVVSEIDIDSELPFPNEYDDLFISLLALRLNPRYGVQTRGETAEAVKRGITKMRSRYRQKEAQSSEEALLRTQGVKRGVSDFEAG